MGHIVGKLRTKCKLIKVHFKTDRTDALKLVALIASINTVLRILHVLHILKILCDIKIFNFNI